MADGEQLVPPPRSFRPVPRVGGAPEAEAATLDGSEPRGLGARGWAVGLGVLHHGAEGAFVQLPAGSAWGGRHSGLCWRAEGQGPGLVPRLRGSVLGGPGVGVTESE